MGWAYGHLPDGTEVGYSVADVCHEEGCSTAIDRGLSYVCGSMHGGDGVGCGGYFCYEHLIVGCEVDSRAVQLCTRCEAELHPAEAAAETKDSLPEIADLVTLLQSTKPTFVRAILNPLDVDQMQRLTGQLPETTHIIAS